ncbi:putative siderophore transport system ATP-binding protein YusV [compost metagenome]
MVAIKDNRIWAAGKPEEIVNAELMSSVFGMECVISQDPLFGTPMVIPHGRGRKPFED